MRLLRERRINVVAPGGNEWSQRADQIRGVDAHVHLAFLDGHPMEYRVKQQSNDSELIWLKIRPDVIKLPGALITDAVSNKSGVMPGSASDMLDKLDLEVIYRRTDWNDSTIKERRRTARKYEILIPNRVARDYILNLPNG